MAGTSRAIPMRPSFCGKRDCSTPTAPSAHPIGRCRRRSCPGSCARAANTNPAALEVYQTIMQNAVDDAVYQKKSAKQALDDAARNIQRAMRR